MDNLVYMLIPLVPNCAVEGQGKNALGTSIDVIYILFDIFAFPNKSLKPT